MMIDTSDEHSDFPDEELVFKKNDTTAAICGDCLRVTTRSHCTCNENEDDLVIREYGSEDDLVSMSSDYESDYNERHGDSEYSESSSSDSGSASSDSSSSSSSSANNSDTESTKDSS